MLLAMTPQGAGSAVAGTTDRAATALHDVFDQTAMGLVLLDAASAKILRVNPAVAALLGRSEQQLLGRRMDEFTHPEDREIIPTVLAGMLDGGARSVQYEQRLVASSGAVLDVVVTGTLMVTAPARPPHVVLMLQDVGELRVLRRALRDERDLGEAVLQGAGSLIVVLDAEGRVLRWNRRCQEVFGFSEAEAISRHVAEVTVAPEDDGPLRVYLAGLVAARVDLDTHISQWVTSNGEDRLISWSNATIETGGQVLLVATGTDVTEVERVRRALLDSEQRFRALVQNGSDVVILVDDDWHLNYVSPAGIRLLGHPFDELLGGPLTQFVHDEDLDGLRAAVSAASASPDRSARVLLRMRHLDGSWRDMETVLTDERTDPVVAAIVLNGRDVTDGAQAHRLVAEESRVLEMIARGLPLSDTLEAVLQLSARHLPGTECAIHLLSPDGQWLELAAASSTATAIFAGRTLPVGSLGGPVGTAAHTRRPLVVADIATDLLTRPTRELAREQGIRSIWCTPLLDSSGGVHGVFTAFRSNTGGPTAALRGLLELFTRLATTAVEHDHAEQALVHQSLHDPLTGLANRVLLQTEIEHALARDARGGHHTAVLVLDLDRFKLINDTFGHARGDALLVRVAETIQQSVRPGDTVARLGGDEFVVLCEDLVGEQDAVVVAERLLTALAEPVEIDGETVFTSASIGIALAAAGQGAADHLLRDADTAMHRAKEGGRRRVELFDERLQQRTLRRWDLENALHSALARAELRVHYQPQVEMATGQIVGVEALLRWYREDEQASVPPSVFVPVAEDTGLIVPIGTWVLRQACTDAVRLVRAGRPTKVSVNLSARQLSHPRLPEDVADALETSGLPPELLCLEVTETVLMDDAPALLTTLRRLRELGVSIAIDDFGTGYSSLLYLKRLPVGSLKIDLSFVAGLGKDPEDHAIVAAIVQMAGSLDLDVVAEGVETETQREHLASLGCRHAQGFLFARPMPFEQLLAGSPGRSLGSWTS